jgi:sortase A
VIAQRMLSVLSVLLLATGIVQGVRGGWIHAKARLAQILLQRSWERELEGGGRSRPWPWADTRPVARLSLPDGGRQIVLEGASGRNLAFAPGHLDGSADPGGVGACVIAGHRDTHFAGLDKLAPGDRILIEDNHGLNHAYRVTAAAVVDESDRSTITGFDTPVLVLVTCWPLDSSVSGGPLRYVVWADEEGR